MAGGRASSAPWLAAAALVGLVATTYWQVRELGFVNFDDPRYVLQNPQVRRGLSLEGAGWAFTALYAGNWHPLTWLSHMLDVELFGLDPGWHHLTNALLHAAATLLLFAGLRSASGRTWPSALAAALFAAHPLHVESVAWVSERKDLLCAAFWFLAMWAHVGWTRRPTVPRYALVVAAAALALLSKPMAVTLPLALLLLDMWPLGRMAPEGPVPPIALLREKIPLLLLSLGSSVATLVAQSRGGAISSAFHLGPGPRVANAVLSYAAYLWQTIWPARLAVVYPHPSFTPAGLATWKVALSALAFAAATALALWQRKRRPYLAVGWAWYVVTLVPAIGLVQVGAQGMADRYTYVPLVGVFVAVAWLAAEAAGAVPWRRAAVAAACAAIVAALAVASRRQAEHWRDSFSLFGHALEVTDHNWMALRNLGAALQDAGRPDEAITALEQSLRLWPREAQTWMNLGISYATVRRLEEAEVCLRRALEMQPGDAHAWYNLGIFYALRGRWEGIPEVESRLRELDPDLARRLQERVARARLQP